MKLLVRPYRHQDFHAFSQLLGCYLREELSLPVTDVQLRSLARDITGEIGLEVPLVLAFFNKQAIGFINFQLDHKTSSWCFHPGWGCIRECYVHPQARGKGIALRLVGYAAGWMRQKGASTVYLTADTAIPFWQHLGCRVTDRINPKNGLAELDAPLSGFGYRNGS